MNQDNSKLMILRNIMKNNLSVVIAFSGKHRINIPIKNVKVHSFIATFLTVVEEDQILFI